MAIQKTYFPWFYGGLEDLMDRASPACAWQTARLFCLGGQSPEGKREAIAAEAHAPTALY